MSKSMDTMSALEGRVAKLEGSIGDKKESLKIERDELKGQVLDVLNANANMKEIRGALNSTKEKIEELKGEIIDCKVVVGKWVLVATPKHKMDVPKPKDEVGEGYGQFSLEHGIVIPCYRYRR
ncbi:hypothetical protein J1N35_020594 [Gossypium stocksii]|uniref:Uncharacterized protein n=1 Tax=Gossypium stocksii TaxID=47602 RepID=A0A9D3VCX3_9ROSI|nr:hypothetical protein J1N35_020594 [Gossypium stocksii]